MRKISLRKRKREMRQGRVSILWPLVTYHLSWLATVFPLESLYRMVTIGIVRFLTGGLAFSEKAQVSGLPMLIILFVVVIRLLSWIAGQLNSQITNDLCLLLSLPYQWLMPVGNHALETITIATSTMIHQAFQLPHIQFAANASPQQQRQTLPSRLGVTTMIHVPVYRLFCKRTGQCSWQWIQCTSFHACAWYGFDFQMYHVPYRVDF